ncbi:MAG: hypothetical protein ACI81S_001202 [Sphingobacteriales bacterium]|jgi:hypothetical protein
MQKIIENAWLIVAILSVIMVTYLVSVNGAGDKNALIFMVVTFLAGFMYNMRRGQRKRSEKEDKK